VFDVGITTPSQEKFTVTELRTRTDRVGAPTNKKSMESNGRNVARVNRNEYRLGNSCKVSVFMNTIILELGSKIKRVTT
jgi:hypothetical protein